MEKMPINHTIDLETVEKLNEVLKPLGYSVGRIFNECQLLELDISLAGKYAYYSEIGKAEENYSEKAESLHALAVG